MFKKIRDFIHEELVKIGLLTDKVIKALPSVVTVLGKIKGIVDNPAIDAIAAILVGSQIEGEVKAAFDFAIDQFTKGSTIAEDVAAQTTTEGKIKVFLEDLIKYEPEVQHMKIGDIAALIIKYLSGSGLTLNQATQMVEAEIAHLNAA